MEYDVLILAAGKGSRLDLGYNKLLYKIDDKHLLEYSYQVFLDDPDCQQIIIVSDDLGNIKTNHFKIIVVPGGETRQESSYKGLQYALSEHVLIHDGARPNLELDTLNRVKQALKEGFNIVVPYVLEDLSDGSLQIEDKYIQTPQGFKLITALKAYEVARSRDEKDRFRDDSTIANHFLHEKTTFVEGDKDNYKITTKENLRDFVQKVTSLVYKKEQK